MEDLLVLGEWELRPRDRQLLPKIFRVRWGREYRVGMTEQIFGRHDEPVPLRQEVQETARDVGLRSGAVAVEGDGVLATRDSLGGASSYDPVHAEWYEDPDAVQPREFLTLGASPEQIRAAYMRYGARFEADENGVLTLRLKIDLGGETVANRWYPHGNELWEFDDEGYMRCRDASINDYKIEESERKFRWER